MPTLESPQKFFGYSKQPYDSYFPPKRPGYGIPQNLDPYGMDGEDERKLRAEQKVLEVLGTLDQIEASKQERAMRQQYAPQIQALAREQFTKPFAGIGAQDRQTASEQRARAIDWGSPEGQAEASRLMVESPEGQAAVLKQAAGQEAVLGQRMFGREQEKEQRAIRDYRAKLPRDLQRVADEALAKGGIKTLPELDGHVNDVKIENDKRSAMTKLGIDPKEFDSLRREDGWLDDDKVNQRIFKQEIANRDRPMTERERQSALGRARDELAKSAAAFDEAELNGDTSIAEIAAYRRDQAIEQIRAYGGDLPKPKPAPVAEPDEGEKKTAFTAKYKRAPDSEADWSQAYYLAKEAKQKEAGGVKAPATNEKLREFKTPEEAAKAGLKPGDRVMVGGRPATWK